MRISNTTAWHLGWDGMSTYSQMIMGADDTNSKNDTQQGLNDDQEGQ